MVPEKENEGFEIKDRRFSSKNEDEKQKIFEEQKLGQEKPVVKEQTSTQQSSSEEALQVNFSALIFSLGTQALIQLGEIEDPATKKKDKNILLAKQTIDLLSILKDKTKGNLTKEEDSMLSSLLYDLRMRFVNASG